MTLSEIRQYIEVLNNTLFPNLRILLHKLSCVGTNFRGQLAFDSLLLSLIFDFNMCSNLYPKWDILDYTKKIIIILGWKKYKTYYAFLCLSVKLKQLSLCVFN